jgi:hypothetical protein
MNPQRRQQAIEDCFEIAASRDWLIWGRSPSLSLRKLGEQTIALCNETRDIVREAIALERGTQYNGLRRRRDIEAARDRID